MAIAICITAALAVAASTCTVHVPKTLKASTKTVQVKKITHFDFDTGYGSTGYAIRGGDGMFYYLLFSATQPSTTQNYFIPGAGNVALPAGASVSVSSRAPDKNDVDEELTVEAEPDVSEANSEAAPTEAPAGENTAAAAEAVGGASGDPVAVPIGIDSGGGFSCGGGSTD